MEKRVLIDTWQKVTKDDFLKFGLFPQGSFDTVVGRLLIPDLAFSGFAVTQTGPAEVTVAEGRLFANGKVFFNNQEGGTQQDMLARLPAVTRRIVAITVWGLEQDSKLEPRTFLVDSETRAVVSRETSTEHWRWANIGAASGFEGPDPQPPAVPTDVMTVAWVTLTNLGVESIRMNTEGMAPTLREADSRLNEFDGWRGRVGTRLDTLGSDLASLATRLIGTARQNFVLDVVRDLSRVKQRIGLPDDYTAWSEDHFLDTSESDVLHVDYLCRIDEGVRFGDAAANNSQIGLLNQFDANVSQQDFFVLPAYNEVARIVVDGFDSEQAISQYPFQTITTAQKTRVRYRYRFGSLFWVCTNWLWWNGDPSGGHGQTQSYDPISGIFKFSDGEMFQVADEDRLLVDQHVSLRVRQVWTDLFETEAYWDVVAINSSISGSIMAETFLNSQDGWLTKLQLPFTRVAATGDVTVLITDTINGAPDYTRSSPARP
jgi:hypothetical protein